MDLVRSFGFSGNQFIVVVYSWGGELEPRLQEGQKRVANPRRETSK